MNLGFYLLYGLSLIMFALPGTSVADFQKSQLPLPDNMDADDVRVLEEIIKLEVYRDTEDPDEILLRSAFSHSPICRGRNEHDAI